MFSIYSSVAKNNFHYKLGADILSLFHLIIYLILPKVVYTRAVYTVYTTLLLWFIIGIV